MKKLILQVLILLLAAVSMIGQIPSNLTTDDTDFFPEDIVIVDNIAYVSGLGDGTVKMFNLNLANPTGETFAEAEAGYSQAWGLKSDGTKLLSILDNANFAGGAPGPAKLVEYDIATQAKTGEWDLPAGSIGHTVSIVDGKYYLTDFGQPRIFEVDPVAGTVNDNWFTSTDWDPTISGIGGTIYDNEGGFYVSQGNKMWYLPISSGTPGTLQEVTVTGLDAIDADGISWDDANNTLYYATNDTGDPANVGTVYKLVFSDLTTAVGSVIATGLDDSSGLWYHEDGGKEYVFVLESQFGALFGINGFEPPFNIEILELESSSDNIVSVYNSFEDATLTGGQQAFYGASGPVSITDEVEFPEFINFYDIDVTDSGLTMTLFNNSDAADLLLPDGRFDRYYFALEGDLSNVSISGGSPGLTANASVTPLPAGYTIPLADLFGTGYPLPITLPNGGFVLELAGGTDLTELGQTISVSFSGTSPASITVNSETFFPEDIVIANNVAYVSSLGDGSLMSFDLTQANPTPEVFAAAEEGYTQRWGVKVDGNTLLSILDNADFGGGMSGPAKLVAYDIASKAKTGEWDLPAGSIGHTVSVVDGKYYVTDFGQPRIFEIDPATGSVNDNWFTSDQWDPTISGIGGTIYDNDGGLYVSQGNKLWYLPISGGTPGTLQEVTVTGLDAIDADGITWVDSQNTLYYATNDTGDPANVGTVYKLVFSNATTAAGSVVATGFDDASGLWYYETGGKAYIYLLESQFGALFGINAFDPPFNIAIIEVEASSANVVSVYNSFEDATLTGGQQAFYGAAGPTSISDDVEFPQFINFYDIDVTDSGLTMTLFNNSDAAALLLPDGRFDRYYFAFEGDMSNVSISGGSPGLTANASVTPLPAGYEIPLADLFDTGYPLPITLPNGGFVLELAGGTDLTELGQTISVSFSGTSPASIVVNSETFFPEDIVIANNVAYVSSLGDGSLMYFDLTQANPTAEVFAAAEEGYTQRWGVKVDGNTLLSILDNADFGGGMSGPAKLVAYDITTKAKTGEWDLPAGSIGHTVSVVDGKYYVTDFGQPRIFEIDPATGTVDENWFTSDQWDPTISGIGGTIYDNEGGLYISQGNKMGYLPVSDGSPGTLLEVTVSGLDAVDADGITWVDSQNTMYYATNDTGDPANVGTVYKLVFSDLTTATGSVVATGFDDASGLWYHETGGKEYIYLLESQFGALFGINGFDPPFNIKVIQL